jgi:predicted dehydrogenase
LLASGEIDAAYLATPNFDHVEYGVKTTDHFGGELKYFSNCILNDEQPEADGEEGLLDVRVLEAVERALITGQVQKLELYHRSRRPSADQVEELGAVKEPELVGAKKPADE